MRQTGTLTVQADIDLTGNALINLPVALWVAPQKVLGGNVGFGLLTPFGWKDVNVDIDALATLVLPNGTTIDAGRHFAFEDSSTKLGDPVLNALIGWHEGNWHWNLSALLNVPIGPWETESISNISFHRWALDTSSSVTYLDAKRGHEVSLTAGFTFNGENPATDYKTGTEFHVEWALMQHVSKTFAFGIAGYHYRRSPATAEPAHASAASKDGYRSRPRYHLHVHVRDDADQHRAEVLARVRRGEPPHRRWWLSKRHHPAVDGPLTSVHGP